MLAVKIGQYLQPILPLQLKEIKSTVCYAKKGEENEETQLKFMASHRQYQKIVGGTRRNWEPWKKAHARQNKGRRPPNTVRQHASNCIDATDIQT